MPSLNPTEIAVVRRSLVELLEKLRAASAATAQERKPVELDQSSVGRLSRMDSMQMQEMAFAAERRRAIETARIEATIKRIDQGDYGNCIVCGEPIAPKRLQADPAIPTCIACAGSRS
jgi:DnaK suppressor protein